MRHLECHSLWLQQRLRRKEFTLHKIKGEDKPALDAAMKQLSDASLELGKAVYEATSAEGGDQPADGGAGAGDAESGAPADDDVIDAEFEVKDEK